MIRFDSDYCEGAHPHVLEKLISTNMEQTQTYGEDDYCKKAAELIRRKCGDTGLDVHFIPGGTQTNLTLISAALRPHQGVISAASGHINVHETGAVEATGHKIISLPSIDGKLTASQILEVYEDHVNDSNHEHLVKPKLVYISHPSELGTIYTRDELSAISGVCRSCGLLLYMDGARMGYGLCARNNDLDLPGIAEMCDAFYIGGTKMGALFGEALVISNPALKEDFRYIIKQKGAMLAKGRLLGLQFLALFENDLYFDIANSANRLAGLIKDACIEKGFGFLAVTDTNQQFPILPDTMIKKLDGKYAYSYWKRIDAEHSAIRFCCSWATKTEDVGALVDDIKNL
ncbi:MAG: threonine aldolase family protein [Saccharofermentanales bacterium]